MNAFGVCCHYFHTHSVQQQSIKRDRFISARSCVLYTIRSMQMQMQMQFFVIFDSFDWCFCLLSFFSLLRFCHCSLCVCVVLYLKLKKTIQKSSLHNKLNQVQMWFLMANEIKLYIFTRKWNFKLWMQYLGYRFAEQFLELPFDAQVHTLYTHHYIKILYL